jgi:hypothetical protein
MALPQPFPSRGADREPRGSGRPGSTSGFRNSCRSRLEWRCLSSAQSLSESHRLAALLLPRVRQESEAADVDHRQVFGRGLKNVAIVVDLGELGPVGRRAPGGRDEHEQHPDAGWSSPVAREADNLEVVGSNSTTAGRLRASPARVRALSGYPGGGRRPRQLQFAATTRAEPTRSSSPVSLSIRYVFALRKRRGKRRRIRRSRKSA